MLPGLDAIKKRADKMRSTTGFRLSPWLLLGVGLSLLLMAFVFMPSVVSFSFSLALFLAPVWLPLLIGWGAWTMWVVWRRSDFIAQQKYILLEIKPPRNVIKTPLAMEAVLAGMHHGPGESTWYKKFIQGGVRPYFSLEIASIEGKVHFFIWTRANFRRLIEAQIYAQYPGTQIVEVPDYTRLAPIGPDSYGIWGCDFKHSKEDPIPLKTYIEYGLEKVQKEPEQVDPLANLIEFMASMGTGEYLWLQLIIRVHKGEKYKGGVPFTDPKTKKETTLFLKDWKEHAKKMVEKIREETRQPYKDPVTGKEVPGFPNPTKGQLEMIAAIERNVAKQGFDVGARGVYIAKPERFDPVNISGLTGIFKQFSSEGWNGVGPTGWMTYFDDYPWEFRVAKLKREFAAGLIDAYRRRQFFYEPHVGATPMVMSTEELATLFHIPSAAVETPSLSRIQSATGEAPGNLPT